MTKQESFKKRIRRRMAKTGERYVAARRALLEASGSDGRQWISQPEMSDEAVATATGRGWDEWCDIIDAWPGCDTGHTAIAAYLRDEHDVDMWWSQGVTGGYERITGRRLPYQRPDGTFTAGKSKTITTDAELIRSMLLDDEQRGDLFPGIETTLRSRPDAKALRVQVGPGVAQISLTPASKERTAVSVQHAGLATYDDVEEWKFYWSDWLDAIDGS